MDVVAEGVEDVDQLTVVRELGIESVQGFYYSPAVRVGAAGTFVDDSRISPAAA